MTGLLGVFVTSYTGRINLIDSQVDFNNRNRDRHKICQIYIHRFATARQGHELKTVYCLANDLQKYSVQSTFYIFSKFSSDYEIRKRQSTVSGIV